VKININTSDTEANNLASDLINKVAIDVLRSVNRNVDLLDIGSKNNTDQNYKVAVLSISISAAAAAVISTSMTLKAMLKGGENAKTIGTEDIAEALAYIAVYTCFQLSKKEGLKTTPDTALTKATDPDVLTGKIARAIKELLPKQEFILIKDTH
jgi:hypothetical protein